MKIKSTPVQKFGKGWIFNVKYSPDGKQIAIKFLNPGEKPEAEFCFEVKKARKAIIVVYNG